MTSLPLISLIFVVSQVASARDYDIRIQRDFKRYPIVRDMKIYWNVPSFMCQKYGINFTPYTQRYGIIANDGDAFRGKNVTILYDPGAFPAMLRSSVTGNTVERNGGIPQHGNITMHLDQMKIVIDQLMPNRDYDSVAVIDFEAWRPIYRQNWGDQEIYLNMSKEDVWQKHPQWDSKTVESAAQKYFERASKVFMETTLNYAQTLRPKAQWGYYGFPYCYNYRSNSGMLPWCQKEVQLENNKIQWLFDASSALYPSLYMSQTVKTDPRRFVIGRMNEACRMAFRVSPNDIPVVTPYMWYKYFDTGAFLSPRDFLSALETVGEYQAGHYVIWGASNDFTSADKCKDVLSYLNDVIGPSIVKWRNSKKKKYWLPSDDEHIDIVSIDGSKVVLSSEEFGKNSSVYQYDTDISQSANEPKPNYEAEGGSDSDNPKIVIYTAVGPNGTKTIYQYETESSRFQLKPDTQKDYDKDVPTTTARQSRDVKRPIPDTPWLKEYMKGFDTVLNFLIQRWS